MSVTMACPVCHKDLCHCEWTQHSQDGQYLELWSTDGHVLLFDYQAMPQIKDCPRNGKAR